MNSTLQDTTLPDFERLQALAKQHVSDADQLTRLTVEITSLMGTVGEAIADADKDESHHFVDARRPDEAGKVITVADAEAIATVETASLKKRLEMRYESLREINNSCKARARYLGGEIVQTGGVM